MQKEFSLMRRLVELLLCATLMIAGIETWAQSPSTQPAKGVLWEVRSATHTAYLFGSIHLAKPDFYPLPPAVEAAYRRADTLAVEVDMTDASASSNAMSLLTYAAPDKLQKHLREETWSKLKSVAGPAVEQLQALRPAVLVASLTVQMFTQQGFDPAYGIDLHFINKAKADRKKLVELETIEFQASVLGGLSDADGDAMVAETLQEIDSGELQRESQKMIEAWKSGNAPALAKILRDAGNKDAGSRRIMKLLLDDRNVGMAQKIIRMLAVGDTPFVVVGAGHLVGANSVTSLLEQQGLRIKKIE